VRRTTNVDIVRPDGFGGPLVLLGAGRDLRTATDGSTQVVATAGTEVVIDFVGDRVVRSVRADPTDVDLSAGDLDGLVGARAGSGFRRQLAERCPSLVTSGSLVHLLLDEVTPATLISGSSLAREGVIKVAADGDLSRLPFGICAGWQPGGAMEAAIVETGVPLLGWGPPAPSLDAVDDPLAWHAMDDLAPTSLRRRRRIDAWQERAGEVEVDVRYRDSYWERDGTETVVHEYGLTATVSSATWTFVRAAAVPGPLPAPECPSAALGASDLVGVALAELREVVRDRFVGAPSCTHLNDVYRSLADLPALVEVGLDVELS
jgi:hypothetical protein